MIKGKEFKITDVDYFENDALLHVNDKLLYFQFSDTQGATLGAALEYLLREGKIDIRIVK